MSHLPQFIPIMSTRFLLAAHFRPWETSTFRRRSRIQTVAYYFARIGNVWLGPSWDPLPGYQDGTFSVTNQTPPLMLTSVGNTMLIGGYAKQALVNGNANVFAYVGQYFTNAFSVTNGLITTTSAGILSEYGEFSPTIPGEAALLTMPDPDQGNLQGTNFVNVIRLSLDVNHDGIMDETVTGPDNTAYGQPYVFWVNNNYDRWTHSTLDGYVEDDVATSSSYAGTDTRQHCPSQITHIRT